MLSLTLSTDWQLSQFTSSTTFKIQHTLNSYSDSVAIVALISDSTNLLEIFEPKKIIPRTEAEVIRFSKVPGWKYKLAIKQIKLPSKPLAHWTVDIFASNVKEGDSGANETNFDSRLQPQFANPKKLLLLTAI